jgi:hypothetical protein
MSILIKVAASRFILTKTKHRGFEVEILDDGRMIFLDYNIKHDQAALEFGYPETAATLLLKRWRDSPASVIWGHMDLPDEIYISLAEDYADHVAHITSTYQKGLLPQEPNFAHAAGMAEDAENIAIRATQGKEPPGYALEQVASLSANAAGFCAYRYSRTRSSDSDEKFDAAKKPEQDWQRRHFVEVMEKAYGETP